MSRSSRVANGCSSTLLKSTWTSGQSTAFAGEVERAILADVRLLLCHEMPGVDGRLATPSTLARSLRVMRARRQTC